MRSRLVNIYRPHNCRYAAACGKKSVIAFADVGVGWVKVGENLVAICAPRRLEISHHSKRIPVRFLLALIVPWFQFFTIGRPIAGIICLLLQLTIIGWLPAAIWSVYALGQYKTDKKIERALSNRA
jgi:hypothetical protein